MFNNCLQKPCSSEKPPIIWVTPAIMDVYIHKDARLNIVRQFSRFGYNASLVAMRSGKTRSKKEPEISLISIPLRYVPVISPIMFTIALFFFLPLKILTSRAKYVIFTQADVCILGSISGLVVSEFTGTKFVLDVRSTPVESEGTRGYLDKLWFSISILVAKRWFDGITVITTMMKDELCSGYSLDSDNVGVWTSAVSTHLYDPERTCAASLKLREELGLADKFVVFYHGVFSSNRGLTETVNAMADLKRRHSAITLFLLGSGPAGEQLRSLIKSEGLQDRVIIHDPVDQIDVPRFIGVGDVCISPLPDHPYWRFQCPLKLLEYLAMKKTVILSDIPAHKAIVQNEECGIYMRKVEPHEIACSIEHAFLNKEKLRKLGERGRFIVESKFTWEKVAKDLEHYLDSISG